MAPNIVSRQPTAEEIETQPRTENLTQEDINQRLRHKRKARGQKACYPCRQRKVGCDFAQPCQRCIDRDHAELCLYEPMSKRTNTGISNDSNPQTDTPMESAVMGWNKIDERLGVMEESIETLGNEMRNLAAKVESLLSHAGRPAPGRIPRDSSSDGAEQDTFAILTSNEATGGTVSLGGNSVPAMVLALNSGAKEDEVQDILGKSILPVFGLDNESATYPFVDLWGLPHASVTRLQALCRLLPNDADCLQYFGHYRDTAHVIFPGVVDIKQFEGELTQFLLHKAAVTRNAPFESLANDNIYGKTLHWVGLLFAILASGYQSSSLPRKERQLTSQVYGWSRFSNLLLWHVDRLQSYSVLCIRMSPHHKLSVKLDVARYPESVGARECHFQQHESRSHLDFAWYVTFLVSPAPFGADQLFLC